MTDPAHTATIVNSQGYRTEIKSRGHTLVADEPVESYGTDTGMSPYELLLASLGACKAITMRMYAQRKGYDIRDIKVEIDHKKVPASECDDVDIDDGLVDKFEVKIVIDGDISEEQRARIIEIGDRCPVQRSVQRGISLSTIPV